MFLTVAIPVYNAELYIEACLESILKQTEKDFEILLVDDGSSDKSLVICETYANKFPDVIRVIHKEHSGSLLTRRICLKEAKGHFIYLMDADDKLIDPDAFQKVRNVIQQTHCDMVIFELTKDEITKDTFISLPFSHIEVFEGDKRKNLYELFVKGTSMNSLYNKIFSRQLVDFETDYSIYNHVIFGTDVFQALPIVSNAKKIVTLKDMYYFYRTNNGGLSEKFSKNALKSYKAINLRLVEFLKKWGMADQDNIRLFLSKKRINGCISAVSRIQNSEELLNNKKECIQFLSSIAEDPYFKDNLNCVNKLSLKERVLVFLLSWHMYDVIRLLFMFKRFKTMRFN